MIRVVVAFVGIFGLGCYLGDEPTSGSRAPLQGGSFDVPDGVSGPDAMGVYTSVLENPVFTGEVDVEDIKELLREGSDFTNGRQYEDRATYGLEVRYLTASDPIVMGSDGTALWLEWGEDEEPNGDILYPFIAPYVSLPEDASTVFFKIMERGGPNGVPARVIASMDVRLDPDTIVLPVHVHVFRDTAGGLGAVQKERVSEVVVRNWLDHSPADVAGVTLWSDPIEDRLNAEARVRRLVDQHVVIDGIWQQCGIQFRLASYEDIEQNDGLEDEIMDGDDCTLPDSICDDGIRLHSYHLDAIAEEAGVHLYLGGTISTECAPAAFEVYGIACRKPCGSAQEDEVARIAISLYAMLSSAGGGFRESIIAHELGHFLSLGHLDVSCAADATTAPNLMNDGGSASAEDAILTPGQCDVARDVAQQYLSQWGP